jgi:hypothetical protein
MLASTVQHFCPNINQPQCLCVFRLVSGQTPVKLRSNFSQLTIAVLLRAFAACRLGTISLLFLPALAWVGFNMLQPATNQLNRMNEIREEAVAGSSGGRKKRGVAGAVGLGAALSMFAAQNADAATELSQLAASDNRCAFKIARFMCIFGSTDGSEFPVLAGHSKLFCSYCVHQS